MLPTWDFDLDEVPLRGPWVKGTRLPLYRLTCLFYIRNIIVVSLSSSRLIVYWVFTHRFRDRGNASTTRVPDSQTNGYAGLILNIVLRWSSSTFITLFTSSSPRSSSSVPNVLLYSIWSRLNGELPIAILDRRKRLYGTITSGFSTGLSHTRVEFNPLEATALSPRRTRCP